MISIEDIVKINKDLTGKDHRVINESSLKFALSASKKTKDWVTQLAYLLRAIVVDHVFEEGNKRTAALIFLGFCKMLDRRYDLYKVERIVGNMALGKVKDIEKIREMIKDATM